MVDAFTVENPVLRITHLGDGRYDGQRVIDGRPDTIRASVEASLQRLRTDRIDIAHLHSCPREVLERGEVVEKAAEGAVESRDDAAGVWTTHTAFHYVETRRDEQTLYAGWATHTLVTAGDSGTLRIKLKRVDLVNCDAAFGNMQLFM